MSKACLILYVVCCSSGSGNVLKVQQLLHTCSEHFDSKEKEEEKEKKEKKDKEKKENSADMGAHQVGLRSHCRQEVSQGGRRKGEQNRCSFLSGNLD